jgi:arginyl-tRNA synthetase
MNLLSLLQHRFEAAAAGLVADTSAIADTIKPNKDPKKGDYQANCAMALAKRLGKKPHDVAAALIDRFDSSGLEKPEIAGPGFINLRFQNSWLAQQLQALAGDDRLGVPPVANPQTFVIDYSSPNVAKPMHVGHLRSTIIGDSLTRLLRFLGHRVITDNHLGDWGTQFGMLIYGWKHFLDNQKLADDPVQEMVRLYIQVRNLIKAEGGDDEEEGSGGQTITDACRLETAKLHQGDEENVRLWRQMMPWCQAELDRIYHRLGILPFDHTLGESAYNPVLPHVVQELKQKGIAQESRGALVVFHGENEPPSLVQKGDGAFTYTTTDLATIRHRLDDFGASVVLYVVDFRQSLHFKQLFRIARLWGYDKAVLEHISFGSVLGQDGKPIKTREGGAISLDALLEEAIQRARKIVDENSPDLSEEERKKVADIVGIGAVKYADLCQHRTTDYLFSWDKMLAMQGNTGTYMQYAYARNRAIFRKLGIDPASVRHAAPLPVLDSPHERSLALAILRFPEALEAAVAEYKPNAITAYLWDLATAFSGFYDNCPVARAATPQLQQSRLYLCDLTARVLQKGLELLGIQTIEKM